MQEITSTSSVQNASHAADIIVRERALELYRAGLAANTIVAQRDDISRWAAFVTAQTGIVCDWHECLPCWQPVTHGLVTVFVAWLATRYATATVNRTIATVKNYVRLAAAAGHVTPDAAALIAAVTGLHGRAAKNNTTRAGAKKSRWTRITTEQRAALRTQPDTPQGRRDAVIVELLLGLGLRVSELQSLTVGDIDTAAHTVQVTRHKTMTVQTLRLHNGVWAAVNRYLGDMAHALPTAPLLMGSDRWGHLVGQMSIIAIQKRIGVLGTIAGIDTLSPHDLRHDWATRAVAAAPLHTVQAAGGWASPAMPLRYAAAADVANDALEL